MDFMKIAEVVAKVSDCLSRQVGSVLTKDGNIMSITANMVPGGLPSCKQEGQCLRRKLGIPSGERLGLCRIIHAEVKAIVHALLCSWNIRGTTLYVTDPPCNMCAHLIVAVGIKKVVYKGDYPGNGLDVLRQGGVEVEQHQPDPIIKENPDEGVIE